MENCNSFFLFIFPWMITQQHEINEQWKKRNNKKKIASHKNERLDNSFLPFFLFLFCSFPFSFLFFSTVWVSGEWAAGGRLSVLRRWQWVGGAVQAACGHTGNCAWVGVALSGSTCCELTWGVVGCTARGPCAGTLEGSIAWERLMEALRLV